MTTPFDNCAYERCDLPGQCIGEGKCHHPKTATPRASPITAPAVDIPISAAKRIAESYGYDQVVIVARRVGVREHVTTYGVDATHCGIAARIGDFFKHKLMGWPKN